MTDLKHWSLMITSHKQDNNIDYEILINKFKHSSPLLIYSLTHKILK